MCDKAASHRHNRRLVRCCLHAGPCSSHLIHVLAGQYAQGPLVDVHDGSVRASPRFNILIRVQTNQQEIPLLLGQLQHHQGHTNTCTGHNPQPCGVDAPPPHPQPMGVLLTWHTTPHQRPYAALILSHMLVELTQRIPSPQQQQQSEQASP